MRQRALIDIDMILDTRYGTLKRIDEKLADALVFTNLYRERTDDNFDLITNGVIVREEYNALYAARDAETLFNSRMTDFVFHFRKDIMQALERIDRKVDIETIEVDINIFPYELDVSEAELIRASLEHYFPWPAQINIVRFSPEDLSPTFVDNSYELLAYYNHEDWLGPNTQAVIDKRIPLVTMITPRISTSGDVPKPDQQIRDPFATRSAFLVKFLALHYIPTSWACYNPFILQRLQSSRC
ncbi:hypothetical protein D3C85_90820 [compost metagenome]